MCKNWLFGVLMSVFLLLAKDVSAQFNNTALFNKTSDTLKSQYLYFDINSFNFVRNYEYFNAFQDGYTLFGTILEPQLQYAANENLIVSLGGFLRKDFGDNAIHDAKPLFSLKYSKNNLSLIFGSLEGNVQHQYIEPLYDLERRITTPIEYGAQLKINKPKYDLDAWIAWEKMIYKPATEQEQIAGGLSGQLKLIDKDYWKLSLPVQFMLKHAGGQIDVNPNKDPLSTIFNGAVGFKVERLFHRNKTFKKLFAENYVVGYKDMSPISIQPFENGNGIWLNAGVTSKFGTFITSYWNGNNFLSIKGTPIFQSLSSDIDYPNYTEKNRSLLFFRYAYQQPILPNLFLDVRIEPIIDLVSPKSTQIDFSNSFFLTYKETFRVGKLKK